MTVSDCNLYQFVNFIFDTNILTNITNAQDPRFTKIDLAAS